ncbi:MAG: ABC transporter permease [Phycisphaerales bacterium JB037]
MRLLQVAKREFVSTVATKGFVIGVIIFPLIMVGAIMIIPRLMDDKPPTYVGEIAIIDRTGWAGDGGRTLTDNLRAVYTKEYLAAELEAAKQQARQAAGEQLGKAGEMAAEQAVEQQLGDIPEITVTPLPAEADLEAQKERLLEGTAFDGGLLAIIVLDDHAVTKGPEGYGAYEAFLRANLDDRFQGPLRNKVTETIRNARIAQSGLDGGEIRSMWTVNAGRPVEVTETGERASSGGGTKILVAVAFMMLLWIAVMTGGQYLMTTVITEKSNRVMEVLLSAVSPRVLMTGKIIGQMGVALAILAVYLAIGLVALNRFGYMDLVSAQSLGLVIVYFFIAFFLLASLMAAIGSAVTEITEAQALLTPIMMVLIIPWMLFMPLTRNPNSTFATVVGLIPPISPFAMVIREAGTDPIPLWQHAAAIVIGIISVFVAIWATAKIFRIGVLMYGKPPNFATLIKWIKMA